MDTMIVLIHLLVILFHCQHLLSSLHNKCLKWPDILVEPGTRWSERCRQCRCVPQTGMPECSRPKCKIPYYPYQEDLCIKWSEDGCCCEQFGCYQNGRWYRDGELFPLFPDDPCIQCTCRQGWGVLTCFFVECERPHCADYVFEKDKCCPVCLNGHNCKIPPLEIGEGNPVTETGDVKHINLGETRIINIGHPRFSWSCTCEIAGKDAECSRQSRLM